jgi:hypothetical protein
LQVGGEEGVDFRVGLSREMGEQNTTNEEASKNDSILYEVNDKLEYDKSAKYIIIGRD